MVLRRKEDIASAVAVYYSRLAAFMVDLVDITGSEIVLEAGCGNGSLTVPLHSLLEPFLYICYDLYAGVYEPWLHTIQKKGIPLVKGDVKNISLLPESVDLIVSNELLCELTRKDTKRAVNEFYRVLKKGGTFVHGVLSPYPENRAQELVVLADTYSAEPCNKEWFSPPADVLAGMLHKAGFFTIKILYFDELLRFEGEAAFEQIRMWETDPTFLEKYADEVREYGLEYPMEQVVYCCK